MEEPSLSTCASDGILKLSRPIADLADIENIEATHLLEAIQYRSLEGHCFIEDWT